MITLGFSIGHDKGAVLIVDGDVKVGISQERLSRVKHDGAWKDAKTPNYDIPFDSIHYCMDVYGISHSDIDLYVYNFTEDYKPASDSVEQEFVRVTNRPAEKLLYIPHHLAHACSTFYSSGFSDAAVIVVDAMGSLYNNKTYEWYSNYGYPYGIGTVAEGHSIFHFSRNSYKEVYKKWIPYPLNDDKHPYWQSGTSLGNFYGTGTRQLVYDAQQNTWAAGKLIGLASYDSAEWLKEQQNTWAAGKLMGLASYANAEWLKEQPDLININFSSKTFKTFGYPHFYYPEINYKSSFQDRANVAGLYQRSLERGIMMLADYVKRNIPTENLCVAGGCFLNCNTNEMLVKSELFKDYFFIPPSDDSGIPLGCAWFGQLTLGLGDFVPKQINTAYLGKSYSENDVTYGVYKCMDQMQNHNFEVRRFDTEGEQLDVVAKMLADNKVVAYFSGGAEIGPRALGHRSILASPKEAWMKEYINAEIKKREWYRPFAPSVLEEHAHTVFELDFYSPFMLVTSQVKPEWTSKIPSVVHVDNTSRFQSVSKKTNPKYHSLISKFYALTGIPLVLNTSFNGNDEPIVESPYDAMRCFHRNKIDALCIENYLITNLKK